MARLDLTRFGFTPTESLVYEVLLTGGPGTGYAIARSAGLARANAYVENARIEYNSARLKFPILNGAAEPVPPEQEREHPAVSLAQQKTYGELCRLGLALTWPIALAVLAIFLVLLLRQ